MLGGMFQHSKAIGGQKYCMVMRERFAVGSKWGGGPDRTIETSRSEAEALPYIL
jgi:hypothetical protein